MTTVALYSDGAEARLLALSEQLGPNFSVFEPSARKWMFVSGDPVVAEHVLVKNARAYKKGFFIGVVELLLSGGLMVSEGQAWLEQRRKVQRMFHERALVRLRAQVLAQNQAALVQWQQQRELDVTLLCSQLVLRTTLTALFGEAPEPFFMLADIAARDMRFRSEFAKLDPLIRDLVRARIANPQDDAVSDLVREDAPDVEQWVREVKTLIVAGHETTASVMAWMWYLLAKHPTQAADSHVIDETMRLYPPGWLLSRQTLAPDTLAGVALPAQSEVLISPYLLGRSAALWPNAQEFQPERFALPPPKFAFIPFSAGPRRCPGDEWALEELRIHLQVMRPVLRFKPPAEMQAEARVNLRPKSAIVLLLE